MLQRHCKYRKHNQIKTCAANRTKHNRNDVRNNITWKTADTLLWYMCSRYWSIYWSQQSVIAVGRWKKVICASCICSMCLYLIVFSLCTAFLNAARVLSNWWGCFLHLLLYICMCFMNLWLMFDVFFCFSIHIPALWFTTYFNIIWCTQKLDSDTDCNRELLSKISHCHAMNLQDCCYHTVL